MSAQNTSQDSDVFNAARNEFLASCSTEDRRAILLCTSATQLVADAKLLNVIVSDKARGRKLLGRIQVLINVLEPYFEVVGIFVQSNPQYAALAWGSLRLILKLASNYATFFEKLTSTLDRLGRELPRYESIAQLCKTGRLGSSTDRIKSSLCQVYVDLLGFFQSLMRVFTKNTGDVKRAPVIMAKLFWQPFNTRFGNLLEQLSTHRNILKDELQLAHILIDAEGSIQTLRARETEVLERNTAEEARKLAYENRIQTEENMWKTAMDSYNTILDQLKVSDVRARETQLLTKEVKSHLEEEYKVSIIRQVRSWLSAPHFAQQLEDALKAREEGTAEWLLENNQFHEWASSTPNPENSTGNAFGPAFLWVQGNPGNGKTVLTASTIDGFKTSKEFEPESNAKICYFFFNYSEKSLNHSAAAYRAILAQILQSRRHEPEVLDRYSFAMNEISSGQASATREELLELLRILLVGPQDYYLFLDGVDECNDSDELVRDLIQIKETSKVRLLISSRPNVEILLREAASTSIVTMSGKTSNDISCYISRNVLSLQARELLSFEADGNTLTRHLVTGADGMFLWAKLMVVYLSSPFMTSEERFEAIQNVVVPEGIETMYERILAHIDRGYKIQKGFADRIFAWLLYAKEPLTALRFMEATGSSPRSAAARNIDDLEEFSRAVVIGCCGLVEGVYEGSGSVEVWQLTHFRFIHLSAKEFFQRASSSRTSGVVTRLESHILIAQKCLQYLTYSAPAGPLSGNTGQDVSQADLDKGFPLCSYAAKYWIDHICRTQGDVDEGFPKEPYSHLLSSLEQFLSQKLVLMAWIEACYVIVHPPTRGKLEDWCVWAAQLQYAGFSEEVDIGVLCQDIQDLMVYLEKLSRDWGKTLSSTQACLWEEVIAFSPCRLLVHTNAIHVHYFESYGPTKRSSSKCLCKISQTTPLGHLMAVLSIWPSKNYEDGIEKGPDFLLSKSVVLELCQGWVARIEIWRLAEDPECIADHRFGLPSTEIWLQLRQSLFRDTAARPLPWKVQFPIAIDADARCFTVLRTLYIFKIESDPVSALESTAFDVEFQESSKIHWLEREDPVSSEVITDSHRLGIERPLNLRGLYLYWTAFSSDSRHLLFIEQDLSAYANTAISKISELPELGVSLNKDQNEIYGYL